MDGLLIGKSDSLEYREDVSSLLKGNVQRALNDVSVAFVGVFLPFPSFNLAF